MKDRKDYVKDTVSVYYETDEVPISTHKSLTDMYNEKKFFISFLGICKKYAMHPFEGKGTT